MKSFDLVLASTLAVVLTACPGDDGGDDATTSPTSTSTPTTGPTGTSTASTGDPTGTPTDDDATGMPTGDDTTTSTPTSDGTTATSDDTGTTTGPPPIECPPFETDGGPTSFEQDVWPIIQGNCLGLPGSCHDPGSGGLTMLDAPGAYANLVDVPSTESPLARIVPGCPEGSYLFAKITGIQAEVGGSGSQMPLGAAALPPEDIGLIEQWINDGAAP